jgi:hypothetical protein
MVCLSGCRTCSDLTFFAKLFCRRGGGVPSHAREEKDHSNVDQADWISNFEEALAKSADLHVNLPACA